MPLVIEIIGCAAAGMLMTAGIIAYTVLRKDRK